MDYDVLPRGWRVEMPTTVDAESLFSCALLAPMLTHGGAVGIENQIRFLASFKGPFDKIHGRDHTSDMIIMRNNLHFYTRLPEECPAVVHYSNQKYGTFVNGAGGTTKAGSRADFTADYRLLTMLMGRRVWMVLPPVIRIRGQPPMYGLGLNTKRMSQLLGHLKQENVFVDEGGLTGMLQINTTVANVNVQDMARVKYLKGWPRRQRKDDLVFVVFGNGTLDLFDVQTRDRIIANLDTLVPLYIASDDCQLIIDYTLGFAAKQSIVFEDGRSTKDTTPSVEETMLRERFDRLVLKYRNIERNLDEILANPEPS